MNEIRKTLGGLTPKAWTDLTVEEKVERMRESDYF